MGGKGLKIFKEALVFMVKQKISKLLIILSFVLSGCNPLGQPEDSSITEYASNDTALSLPDCTDNSVTTEACKIQNVGVAVTSDINSITAANIVSGITLFGVLGTASGPYSPCTDEALNAGICSTAANRYVTATAGSDITSWSNSTASTTVVGNIANGYYDGKSIMFTDSNLIAANIKSGVSIFGVNGSVASAYSACTDDALNTSQCSTSVNRYVTPTLGGNISGANASLSVIIPTGFYDGTKLASVSDANLLASNIKSGVSIFGVSGSVASAYSSCTDDTLNTGPCSTAANRYVTATSGANITSWSNASALTTMTGSIATGYYSGKSCEFTDANLIAANIKSGTNIFGVTGSLTQAYSACIDGALNSSQCSTAANRYVTATLGGNVSGANASLSVAIPTGFYDGTKSASVSDTNLLASNIKSGVSVFGVSGSVTSAYSDCTDDALNISQCSTDTNRYVTSTNGANITGWSNSGATTTISASMPTGFYSGKSVSFTNANLLAANIASGASIFGVAGTYTQSPYSGCTDDALNASQCSTSTNRYVTSQLRNSNVTGTNASLTVTLPFGFYNGTKTVGVTDSNLIAANIKTGIGIFGTTGNLIAPYADCTDDALNVSQCSTAANRYVASVGANITTWTNTGATTTVSGAIPGAYYSGNSVLFTDGNLVPYNLVSGASIFGVTGTGTLVPAQTANFATFAASSQFRDKTTTQVSLYNEAVTNAGVPYTNTPTGNPGGYRAVSDITKDDDGYTGGSSTIVNRTSPAWGATTCGTSQATIADRIADCAIAFGASATWDGSVNGNAGQGQWKLVSRSGSVTSSKGREVWQDQRTKLLWSSLVSTSLNWCKASGSNFITNNPAAEDDPSNYCDSSSYQNTGTGPATKAVSACFEDGENYFTTTDGSIDNLGKVGLNLSSTPAVAWRLPSLADYEQAEVNGIRFVMPDMLSGGSVEWSASVYSASRSLAWYFISNYGGVNNNARYNNNRVRCVGR